MHLFRLGSSENIIILSDLNSAMFRSERVPNLPTDANNRDMILYDFINSNDLCSFNSVLNDRGNTLNLVLASVTVTVDKHDSLIENVDLHHPPLHIFSH